MTRKAPVNKDTWLEYARGVHCGLCGKSGFIIMSGYYAGAWLRGFRSAIEAAGLPWYPPHVAGSDEEISLEWWRGNRNLTVFVRGFEVEVLRVSGLNMNTDINTLYRVDPPEDAVRVWRWLRGE